MVAEPDETGADWQLPKVVGAASREAAGTKLSQASFADDPPASDDAPEAPQRLVPPTDAEPSADSEPDDTQPRLPLPEDPDAKSAAPEDSEGGALSLADLEAMALASNPTLRDAALGVSAARGVQTQTGLRPNPTFGYSAVEMGIAGTAGQQGAFASQTIVTGRKLKLNRAVARWDVEEASWIAEVQRYRVINDTRLAYVDVLGAQRTLELANELVDIAEKAAETARKLLDAGEAARPDYLQAQIQVSEIRVLQRNAELQLEAAWQRLASVIGRPDLPQTTLAGDLNQDVPELSWEETWNFVVSSSPELQRAQARVNRARMLIQRHQAQPTPNLNTRVAVANDFTTDDAIAGFQVGIPLPVHNRNQGNVRKAVAEYHRARQDLERTRLALRSRLATAIQDYAQAKQTAERYADEILPTSKDSLDLITLGLEQGQFGPLRLLSARQGWYDARVKYVNALVQLNRADVQLDGLLLTGGLDEVPRSNDATGLRSRALSGQ